mmetsp:Transcript_24491/g.55936  ORF Transcript_24491/g.55936 Transcript_24491/m.55936 type:complete len:382 (+) Transcript_24491:428-1573(+)
MLLGDGGHGIRQGLGLLLRKLPLLYASPAVDLGRDGVSNSVFGRTLTYLGDVSAGESLRHRGQLLIGDVLGHRGLPEIGPKDGDPGLQIGQGYVNELVQTSWPHDTGIQNVRPVGGPDDEEGLAPSDAVDLGEDLVDDSIGGVGGGGSPTPPRPGDGVHLVEEEDTGAGRARLVEEVADVGLGTSEPHVQQFWSFDGDEIGATFVGDGLGHEGLSASGRSVEEHTPGGLHSKFLKESAVFDGIPDHLLQFSFSILQSPDVLPFGIRHLYFIFAQGGRIGGFESMEKVVVGDHEGFQDFFRYGFFGVHVHRPDIGTDALECRFQTELLQISSNISVGILRNLCQIHISRHFHIHGLNLENIVTSLFVRDEHLQFAVETARTA